MNEVMEFILRLFLELFFELAMKGPGYLLARWLYPREQTDPDGCLVVVLGIAFWIAVGALVAVSFVFF